MSLFAVLIFVIAMASVESFPGTNSTPGEPNLVIDLCNSVTTAGKQDNVFHLTGIKYYLLMAAIIITMIWISFITVCIIPRTKHVTPFVGTPFLKSGWEMQQELQKDHIKEFRGFSLRMEDLVY